MKLAHPIRLLMLCVAAVATAQAVRIGEETPLAFERRGPAAESLQLPEATLRHYLALALNRAPSMLGNGTAPRVTFVLEAQAEVWSQLPASALSTPADIDGYAVVVSDGETPVIELRALTVLGVHFAVMDFLREVVGIEWLFPGELGLQLPDAPGFKVTRGWERRPAVASRLYTGLLYGDPETRLSFRQQWAGKPVYGERLFFEAYDYFKSLKLHNLCSISHNMINIFPVAYAKAHPELLPIRDGRPYQPPDADDTPGGLDQAWHPCYSAPLATTHAIELAGRAFDGGAFSYSLGINDGKRVQCQCERCGAIGWPETYYRFVTTVAEALHDRYPPHLLGVLVYGDVRHPRADLKLPDNVIAMITGRSPLAEWRQHASHLGKYEYMFGQGFAVPCFPLKAMTRNARVYREFGVTAFRAEAYPIWAFDGPKVSLVSHLLWDPDLDVQAALDQWCERAFGERAAPLMALFYRFWGTQWDYLVDEASPEPSPLTDMSLWRNSQAQFRHFGPVLMRKSTALIDQAELASQRNAGRPPDAKQAERLAMVATTWRLSANWAAQAEAARQAFDPDAPAGGAVKGVAELRNLLEGETRLTDAIAAHPAWTEGAGQGDRGPGWSLDKEARTAMLTWIWRGRDQAGLDVGPLWRPYLAPVERTLEPSVKDVDKGTYYSLPEHRDRFTPLVQEATGNRYSCRTGEAFPLVPEERPREGLPTQHYGSALIMRRRAMGPVLFKVEIEGNGRQGELAVSLTNLWSAEAGDGLPVKTSLSFGATAAAERRELVIEPVLPESWHKQQESYIRLVLLWTPAEAGAPCGATITVTQIDLKPSDPPKPEVTPDQAVEDLLKAP